MSARWVETTPEVYAAIYRQHIGDLTVFGSFTDVGDYSGEPRIMTEWGFKSADHPIIKSDRRGNDSIYYIAAITDDEDTQ